MKAQRQYPNTRKWRDANFKASLEVSFKIKMYREIAELRRKGQVKFIRIHSSGDFYNWEYAWKWGDIAAGNPDFIFYAYTKTKHEFPPLKNLIIHNSLPKGVLNYGKPDHIASLQDWLENACDTVSHVCPATRGHDDVQCGLSCTWCMSKENQETPILFMKH